MSDQKCYKIEEIERLTKIVAGNGGQGGLVREVQELKTNFKHMEKDLNKACEAMDKQATAMNGMVKFMTEQETLSKHAEKERKSRRQTVMFAIAQSLVVIGLIITLIIALKK